MNFIPKRFLCLLLAAAIALLLLFPAQAVDLGLSAPSAILIEKSTGTVLYEQNAHERLRPASVTKVMTLLLTMEALESGKISLDDTVTVSATAAAKGGSQIYLEENEQLPLEEVLKSVVVASANDCACALAELLAGSEAAFAQQMNERAAELGMADTHFVNCTGLDDEPEASEHLTTAYDIALMSRELLKHDKIKDYTTIWTDTVRNGTFGLSNTNKLIRFYDGATGLKTGFTSAAGFCLSASAERDGMELIAVVLHCATSAERFESAKALLNYGFSNYGLFAPSLEQDCTVPVTLGKEETVRAILSDETPLLLEKSQVAGAEQSITLDEAVQAPVEEGQQLGTLTITASGETIAEIPLVAESSVARLSWWDLFRSVLRQVFLSEA